MYALPRGAAVYGIQDLAVFGRLAATTEPHAGKHVLFRNCTHITPVVDSVAFR